MNSPSPSNETFVKSYDGKDLTVGSIGYQMAWKDGLPRLIQIKIMESRPINMVKVFIPGENIISSFISSTNIHTDPKALAQVWLDNYTKMFNDLPKVLNRLAELTKDPSIEQLVTPEVGGEEKEVEI